MEPRPIPPGGDAFDAPSLWRRVALAVLVSVAAVIFFYRLGSIGLIDADEPRYSEAAREMRERGDFLIPWLNGEPRLNKPPLVYWAIAASQSVCGTNEWASRLPSALAALVILAVIFLYARRRAGSAAATLSAIVFVTSPLVFMVSRLAIPDMFLAAFETIAVLCLYSADRAGDDRSRSRHRIAAWAALGLATMTKGPVGVAVPLLVLGAFLAVERRLRDVRRLFSLPALALFVAITVPWYLAVGIALGFREGLDLLVHETLFRYSSASFHSEPITFFAGVFAVGFVPWTPLVLAAIVMSRAGEPSPERRFYVAWIAVVLVFFSLSPSKLPTYILPLAPAVALLTGTALARADRQGATVRQRSVTRFALGAGAALLAMVAVFAAVAYGILQGNREVTVLALVLAALALVPLVATWRARPGAAALVLAGFVALSVGAVHRFVGDDFEQVRSMKPLTSLFATIRRQDALLMCDIDKPGVIFYSRRVVETTDSVDELAERLCEGPRTFAVVRRARIPDLLRRMGSHEIEVLWRHESWTVVRGRP